MDIQLDASNYGSYAYFTARHFQYGSEVVPMAGPYGFVPYGFTYAGMLFWKRLALELLTKLVLGALIVWFFRRASSSLTLRCCWLFSVVILAPIITDLPYILAILLSGLFLIAEHGQTNRRSLGASLGVAAYLALLTLFKGTQTMLALATLGLLAIQALGSRRFQRLAWILGAYLIALVGLWLAAGQDPRHFPGYVRGILELSSGYNAAMGLDEPWRVFLTGLTAAFALVALVWVTLWPHRRSFTSITGGLLLIGVIFILWKHGFVRADGHTLIFFYFAVILAFTIPLFFISGPNPAWTRRTTVGLLAVIVGLSLWADGQNPGPRFLWNLTTLPPRLGETVRQLIAPAEAKADLDTALATQRRDWQLPRFQALVGRASVDFFGNELGYLLLNRFNYRPRPMSGGTFNVYTPWLRDRNVAHLQDGRARPEYFIANFQTIDDRFAAQDDAGTLLALLHNYQAIELSSGLLLFKATPTPPAPPALELISTRAFAWDEPIAIPVVSDREMVLMSLELPPSLSGQLRQTLYKAPLVFMDLTGAGIAQPQNRRIIPLMFRQPVPLNPVLETNEDLLDLIEGQKGKTAHTLTLKTLAPGCFDRDALRVSFFRAPRPPPMPRPPETSSHTLISAVDPKFVEGHPTFVARENGLVYQVLIPPGRFGYVLRGDETELKFTYGMTAPTYELPTDGVDVVVELQRPGQPPQILFQQHHTPRQRPEQRGPQPVRLPLPPCPPGSILNLRTGRGPDNDGAWDLVYLTAIRFAHGPYTPAQFPGFTFLPSAVTADNCGRLPDGDREVFLLNSPGALTFKLPARAHSFQFKVGLLAGAYTGNGHSDGVEVTVDLRTPQGSLRQIFRRQLDPRSVPEDRGDRSFDVPLSAFAPGTELILTLGPGPAGDASWDWSYISEVNLR